MDVYFKLFYFNVTRLLLYQHQKTKIKAQHMHLKKDAEAVKVNVNYFPSHLSKGKKENNCTSTLNYTMSSKESKPSGKRALSLDDLVNHDDNDKVKLQKLGSDIKEDDNNNNNNNNNNNTTINGPATGSIDLLNSTTNTSSVMEISNPQPKGEIITTKQRGDEISPRLPPAETIDHHQDNNKLKSRTLSQMMEDGEDETDTDDDVVGNGEIKFDSPMAFDYEKQDRSSPLKTSPGPKKLVSTLKKEADLKPKESLEKKLDESKKTEGTNNKVEKSNVEEPISALNNEKTSSKAEKIDNIFEEKASLQSKKNNVKKDLQVLNEIRSVSRPSKYKNAPIWAQKWKPTVKALQNIDTKDFKIDSSFLNIIPDDDLTKSVQDWVYATIHSIAPDLRPFIELEMKFGVIIDAKGPDRVSPPISSQAIFTDMDSHLTPNVDESLFKELNKYIQGVSELNENSGKFSIIESHTRDSVYRVGLSTQRPRFLRMSTDVKTGRVGQFIEKRHVAQLLLFSPKDSYDGKISINLELPVPENDPPEKYLSQSPVSQRTKERISYIHNDSCTRIDITKVHNHNQGVKAKDVEVTHEIELEINTPALLSAFDNILNDSKEYASVIRTFLNNSTIIRRKLTSLSYEIFEGQKKI
ncbi:polynucleotide 5'-phosphatase NDAI_0F01410 [Naumovozyma dairenensis CBS 421]|uniref:mRNA-capping enzyme subunit beta n=1 Tax=Naumovozyma dairenensis (strain ATCC 10597 / BCRC 20456 / CBS 421 / NBRC 0211 / NRRL Y-12639) TaxID=1071378 RepID=G0WCE9_NAUDC|nr:hypothetical protein NDAI_0F01410 [Naumovozyma dairenensis CBS 421]CCD25460.1 hypothetical protein NDAI_0F01410 [Naumovozyma dairenensis CBS 421]